MKKYYSLRFLWCLLLLVTGTTAPIYAQTQGNSIARNIVLEKEGNIIPIIPTPEGGVGLLTQGSLNEPIILNKINADGSVAWRLNIGRFGDSVYGANRRIIQAIATSDGGFALIGYYQKPVIRSENFSVVLKIDAAGNQTWYKEILVEAGPITDLPAQIIQTRDGGYLVTIDGNMPKIVAGVGVLKLDQGGNVLFTRYYDLPGGNSLAMSSVKAVAETNSGYVLVGGYLPNYATNRTFEAGAIFQLIDGNGNLMAAKGFYPTDLNFSDVRFDPLDNSLFIKTTTNSPVVPGPGVLKTDLAGNIKFRYTLTDSNESFLTITRIQIAPNPQDGYIIVDTKGGVDFRLTRLDRSGSTTSVQLFGGSSGDLLYDTRILPDGKILLVGLTESLDGDLANRVPGPYNGKVWLLTLTISNLSTPMPSGFVLTTPAYDCNTGQLTLNTSGGNGSTIEYRIVGNRDWSASNVFIIPSHQRQGTTFTLEARQSGQAVFTGFTTVCGTTPPVTPPTPPTPPNPPTPPSGFALTTPAYDCNTGQLTLNTSGGNDSAIEYRIVGNRDWSASNVFAIPSHQRVGTTFTLDARQNGQVVSLGFTAGCSTSTPPSTPPSSDLSIRISSFECATGQLIISTSGGNGSLIEYKVPGLADWQVSPDFIVPIHQRRGTTFTAFARQSGREVQQSIRILCANAREAVSVEPGIGLNAMVIPNPLVGNELVVEVTGASGQTVDFALSDLNGRTLTTQQAEVVNDRHRQTMAVGSLIEGIYLLRVSTPTQAKTVKVMKQ